MKRLESNSHKSARWSAVPVSCLSRLWLKLKGEQGSGPETVNDLCFHTYGGFFPPPPSSSSPPSLGDSRMRFGPRGWDMGLEALIWAWWLGGGGGGGEGGGEEEGENPPYV